MISFRQPDTPAPEPPLRPGDKILCIDVDNFAPLEISKTGHQIEKGKTYTLRQLITDPTLPMPFLSIMEEPNPNHFYRACRFRKA